MAEGILVSEIIINGGSSETINKTIQLTPVINPEDAEDKSLIWDSSDKTIATVDENGLVSTLKIGTTNITATSVSNPEVIGTKTITVVKTDVTGITLTETTKSVIVGQTYQIVPTVNPSDATNKNVTYSSGSNAIATVSITGLVTAISSGTTTITVISNDNSEIVEQINVTVLEDEKIPEDDVELNQLIEDEDFFNYDIIITQVNEKNYHKLYIGLKALSPTSMIQHQILEKLKTYFEGEEPTI